MRGTVPGMDDSVIRIRQQLDEMDHLVVWLRQQLDDEEQLARALAPGIWAVDYPGSGNYPLIFDTERGTLVDDDHGLDASVAEHIALHDPARVLREVEAKRRMLTEVKKTIDSMDRVIELEWGDGFDGPTGESYPLLKLLALPYSDRPGYREEWKQP